MPVDWVSLSILAIGSVAGFIIRGIMDLAIEDRKEDRDWCIAVEAVSEDIANITRNMTTDTAADQIEEQQEVLDEYSSRLEEAIADTPPYRHDVRRQLASLQRNIADLVEMDAVLPGSATYRRGELVEHIPAEERQQTEEIAKLAEEVERTAQAVKHDVNYHWGAFTVKFVRFNFLP